jgi:hypothetical protein
MTTRPQRRQRSFARALVAWGFLILFAFALGATAESRSSYCQHCGLLQGERRWTWFDIPLNQWQTHHRTNEYHRLYTRYVSDQCSHQWRQWTHGWVGLMNCGVGCGHFPQALFHPERLSPLARLHDGAKIAAVLTSIDLSRDSQRQEAIFAAVAELTTVSTALQEERWWQKHRRLFAGAARPRFHAPAAAARVVQSPARLRWPTPRAALLDSRLYQEES